MEIDFIQKLRGLDGKPLTQILPDGKTIEVDLKEMSIIALTRNYEDEVRTITGKEKFERSSLAQKIYNAKGKIDLESTEIAKVKDLIGKTGSPVFVKSAWDLLEGKNDVQVAKEKVEEKA